MAKEKLTDRTLKSLKPRAGKLYDVMDSIVPGFGVRVSENRKTFILLTRYPGSNNPTRRALGEYDVMGLEEAREKAREWRKLIKRKIDPRDVEERRRKTLRSQPWPMSLLPTFIDSSCALQM
jgi:Arm DNA-binding domain